MTVNPVFGPGLEPALIAAGRYAVFHGGHECGAERWQIESASGGLVASGEHVLEAPHPFPSRQEWRATLTRGWRLTGLEIVWRVGARLLRAVHGADGPLWRARIEYGGQVREQHGDYPGACEVEYVSPLFHAFILARRDFALGGEHEFPVLRIGPPWMAVTPERMLYRCVEVGRRDTARGPVEAKRYVVSQPRPAAELEGAHAGEDEGYSFWADAQGFVLESHEAPGPSAPWMRLVELRGGLEGR